MTFSTCFGVWNECKDNSYKKKWNAFHSFSIWMITYALNAFFNRRQHHKFQLAHAHLFITDAFENMLPIQSMSTQCKVTKSNKYAHTQTKQVVLNAALTSHYTFKIKYTKKNKREKLLPWTSFFVFFLSSCLFCWVELSIYGFPFAEIWSRVPWTKFTVNFSSIFHSPINSNQIWMHRSECVWMFTNDFKQ